MDNKRICPESVQNTKDDNAELNAIKKKISEFYLHGMQILKANKGTRNSMETASDYLRVYEQHLGLIRMCNFYKNKSLESLATLEPVIQEALHRMPSTNFLHGNNIIKSEDLFDEILKQKQLVKEGEE